MNKYTVHLELKALAQDGNLENLKKFYKKNKDFINDKKSSSIIEESELNSNYNFFRNSDILETSAEFGHLDCLKYLVSKKFKCDEKIYNVLIYNDHVNILEYILEKECKYENKHLKMAIIFGSIKCTKFLIEKGFIFDYEDTVKSAKKFKVLENEKFKECIRYALISTSKRDSKIEVAALSGDIETVELLINEGCEFDINQIYSYAKFLDVDTDTKVNKCINFLALSTKKGDQNTEIESNQSYDLAKKADLNSLKSHSSEFNKKTCEFAASSGDFKTFKYVYDVTFKDKKDTDSIICKIAESKLGDKKDYKEILKYAILQGSPFSIKCCKAFVSDKNIDLFKSIFDSFIKINKNCDSTLPCLAAKDGNIYCLIHMLENGADIDKTVFVSAVNTDNVSCVSYLIENYDKKNSYLEDLIKISDDIKSEKCGKYLKSRRGVIGKVLSKVKSFTSKGDVETIEKIKEIIPLIDYRVLVMEKTTVDLIAKCKNNESYIVNHAAETGNLELLKYCGKKELKIDEETSWYAALNNHLDCLKFLHEKGYRWNYKVCDVAAQKEYLDILQYAHQNGCPFNKTVVGYAAASGNIEILKYVHDKMCIGEFQKYWNKQEIFEVLKLNENSENREKFKKVKDYVNSIFVPTPIVTKKKAIMTIFSKKGDN